MYSSVSSELEIILKKNGKIEEYKDKDHSSKTEA